MTKPNEIEIEITDDDLNISDFDIAEYLTSPEATAEYLKIVLHEHPSDTGYFLAALGNVVRAQKMMGEVAAQSGKGRTSLYKSLSQEGKPAFETIEAVLSTLGLELTVQPKQQLAA